MAGKAFRNNRATAIICFYINMLYDYISPQGTLSVLPYDDLVGRASPRFFIEFSTRTSPLVGLPLKNNPETKRRYLATPMLLSVSNM